MRLIWMGMVVLGIILLPVAAAAEVTISPNYLYQNTPVTISYPALTSGEHILIGFDAGFTPDTIGAQGIVSSSMVLPFSLNPGNITSVDGRLFNTSHSFVSDTNGTVNAGTFGVRVMKEISTAGTPVNLSWMLNGSASGPVSAGEILFLPVLSPKVGILNVTVQVGTASTTQLIRYNQNIAAPSVTSKSVSVVKGQTGYGDVALNGLTTGLKLYNLTLSLGTSAVGNFTNVTVPAGITFTNSTLPSSAVTVNATVTTAMTGAVNLAQALNLSYKGLSVGSSPINVTVNKLLDSSGADISPVVVTNGTLTVNSPPLPGAEFYGTPTSGIIPFNVSFLYTSPDEPNGFNWSFDDGTGNATIENPVHTYWSAGSHDVTLTVLGASDNNTKVRENYISARQVPVWFMGNCTSGPKPLSVSFNGSASPTASSWVYYFGDGGVGYEPNMTHTYQAAGVYTVRAQAAFDGAKSSAVRNQYITVT